MRVPRKAGRPGSRRIPAAGEQLRRALKILGKTWRKNVASPDHVLNWTMWEAFGLPRSPTTIDADMRLGVPEERLGAYAQCLGLAPEVLADPGADIRAALWSRKGGEASLPDLGLGAAFLEGWRKHNDPRYVRDLFALIGGAYRVFYVLPIFERINRCAFWFQEAQEDRIAGRGLFFMFGLENFFEAAFFRWHNNLHGTFLCANRLELGYLMFVDPLRHNLIARRDPFWLKGKGMTDSGLVDNAPAHFTFLMEKLSGPGGPGGTGEEDGAVLWERECEEVRRAPSLGPDDPDFEALRERILAPDLPA